MTAKRWLIMFLIAVIAVLSVLVLLNVFVDPFGVFGDIFYNWDSYNFSNNPQAAKLAYLKRHGDEFDSFIIGSSTASSYSTKRLNDYTGGHFYNLFSYGGDMQKNLRLIQYLLENYDVKRIVIPFGIREGLISNDADELNNLQFPDVSGVSRAEFWGRFMFADPRYAVAKIASRPKVTYIPQGFYAFVPQTGEYNKIARDVEYIRGIDEYLANNPGFNQLKPVSARLNGIGECTDALTRIRDLCNAGNTELLVIFSPEYDFEYECYPEEDLDAYRKAIASVTDYWDFSLSSASNDPRYFYDAVHSRNALCNMVLARIFNDGSIYVPQDFGLYVKQGSSPLIRAPLSAESYTCDVPVLLFHHFADGGDVSTTISPAQFEENIAALYNAGYTAVTPAQLYDYVYRGVDLPALPVVITIDDGYYSNYEFAYPILKKYGFNATIFTIGVTIGSTTYKDMDIPVTPHFGPDEMREMVESGVITIGSHTYDMHNSPEYDVPFRNGALRLATESEAEYIAYFRNDITRAKQQIEEITGKQVSAFAFPGGMRDTVPDVLLQELGFTVTFTTQTGVNTLVKGLPQSLLGLKRNNVISGVTGRELLDMLAAR